MKDYIQVATYNINCCRDYKDGRGDKSPNAVAEFIYDEKIDICGLNEVDVNSERSLGYNQPEYIRDRLTELTGEPYYYVFAPSLEGYHPPMDPNYEKTEGKALYGNALISRFPIQSYRTVKVALKEKPVMKGGFEHRIFIIAEFLIEGELITVITTHFGTTKEERFLAIDILEKELKNIHTPVIFMGDLNAAWSSEEITRVGKLLAETNTGGDLFTFDSVNPHWQIDYIYTSEDFEAKDVRVPEIYFSDHRPIAAKLRLL